ncbi:MAG: MarR family transcriptional regulator [Thioalkalispiraceae bacterium]|jgi:MarR family transcriptional regulator for hemolysin
MPAIEEQLGMTIGEVARIWRTRLNERLRPLGLSQSRWMVLLLLSRRGDGVMQKQLAEWIGIEGPTLVRTLDRMTEDGWLERRESKHDRRVKTVHLTEQSISIIKQINQIANGLRRELLTDISSDELETCMHVLQKIKQAAEAM